MPPGVMPLPNCGGAEFSDGDFFVGQLLLGRVVYRATCDNPIRNMTELAIYDDCKFGKPN